MSDNLCVFVSERVAPGYVCISKLLPEKVEDQKNSVIFNKITSTKLDLKPISTTRTSNSVAKEFEMVEPVTEEFEIIRNSRQLSRGEICVMKMFPEKYGSLASSEGL